VRAAAYRWGDSRAVRARVQRAGFVLCVLPRVRELTRARKLRICRVMVSQFMSLLRISQRFWEPNCTFVSQKRTHWLGIPERSIDNQQTSLSELLSSIIRGREQCDAQSAPHGKIAIANELK